MANWRYSIFNILKGFHLYNNIETLIIERNNKGVMVEINNK